jgi:hypothetical protein
MANYSTGMLANLNGQDNYFDEAAPTTGMAAAAEEAAEETATGMFPPQDPSGISVLQKTLLPLDDSSATLITVRVFITTHRYRPQVLYSPHHRHRPRAIALLFLHRRWRPRIH